MILPKILDCTLRDGGYYTNWDFSDNVSSAYFSALNNLPVDYIEIGYRSKAMKEYFGKYFYSPVSELQLIRKKSNKKIVIILNEKDVAAKDVKELLEPCIGLVDMIRIALDPEHLSRAFLLAEEIRKLNFEIGFNVMYMSKWKQYPGFISQLNTLNGLVDYFYMVDSYGGVYPSDVIETMELVKNNTTCKIGFHGHNNLELGLINSLTAVEHGAEIIDSTVLGMGRGAGNLKTELLLSVLNKKYNLDVDFNALGDLVNAFDELHKKYEWGTNLPYMISGSNSLPQKEVMDWVTTRFYSFNSIIQALKNQKQKVEDNDSLPTYLPSQKVKRVLIIGGGKKSGEHAKAIVEFLEKNQDILVIYASSKNAYAYKNITAQQIFCLVGNEGKRLETVFENLGNFDGTCVLPPYPRKMGTYVPSKIYDKTYQLASMDFTKKFKDSHTALALQIALLHEAGEIFLAGYDGYQDVAVNNRERTLTYENEYLFSLVNENKNVKMFTLTPSNYKILNDKSIYSLI